MAVQQVVGWLCPFRRRRRRNPSDVLQLPEEGLTGPVELAAVRARFRRELDLRDEAAEDTAVPGPQSQHTRADA